MRQNLGRGGPIRRVQGEKVSQELGARESEERETSTDDSACSLRVLGEAESACVREALEARPGGFSRNAAEFEYLISKRLGRHSR